MRFPVRFPCSSRRCELTGKVRRAHNLSIAWPICQPIFYKGIELARIGAEGADTATLPETGPMVVPVDAARGSAWIADQLRQAVGFDIQHLLEFMLVL